MSQAKNYRKNKLIPVGIFILYWLIPLVYAAVSGQPEAGLTGFQAVKSAVSSLFCTKGYTHLILIFFIELGLVIFGLIYIRTRKQKLTWGNGFGKDGGLLLVFLLLLIVPFIIACKQSLLFAYVENLSFGNLSSLKFSFWQP
ncbi:MAG: hypothetical protein P8Y72_14180 [Anaerolineales bacterium]